MILACKKWKYFDDKFGKFSVYEVKDTDYKKNMICDESSLKSWIEENNELNEIFDPDEYDGDSTSIKINLLENNKGKSAFFKFVKKASPVDSDEKKISILAHILNVSKSENNFFILQDSKQSMIFISKDLFDTNESIIIFLSKGVEISSKKEKYVWEY